MSIRMLAVFICGIAYAQPVSSDAPAIQDFQKRIAAYMQLHEKAVAEQGKLKPTPSPERISHHEQELAQAIRAARGSAAQGNIFTSEITSAFRRIVSAAMEGKQATTVHQSLRRSEPVALPLKVNGQYPDGTPLQTTPPSLLANLPALPKAVEYRVVNHALVLRDVAANLIVDFCPDVIP